MPHNEISPGPRDCKDNTEYSPPQKMSPRMMRKIQGQLNVSQKRVFDTQAIVSMGHKQRPNNTIAHNYTYKESLDSGIGLPSDDYSTISPRGAVNESHIRRTLRQNCATLDPEAQF